jgi:hypothetical protein
MQQRQDSYIRNGVGTSSDIMKYIPSIPNYSLLWFCPNFDQVYRKMYQHLQYQIIFVKFSMKYTLIVHYIKFVDVDIFF